MATFHVDCETCPYTAEAASVADALEKETEHKRQCGTDHRVTIERSTAP